MARSFPFPILVITPSRNADPCVLVSRVPLNPLRDPSGCTELSSAFNFAFFTFSWKGPIFYHTCPESSVFRFVRRMDFSPSILRFCKKRLPYASKFPPRPLPVLLQALNDCLPASSSFAFLPPTSDPFSMVKSVSPLSLNRAMHPERSLLSSRPLPPSLWSGSPYSFSALPV